MAKVVAIEEFEKDKQRYTASQSKPTRRKGHSPTLTTRCFQFILHAYILFAPQSYEEKSAFHYIDAVFLHFSP